MGLNLVKAPAESRCAGRKGKDKNPSRRLFAAEKRSAAAYVAAAPEWAVLSAARSRIANRARPHGAKACSHGAKARFCPTKAGGRGLRAAMLAAGPGRRQPARRIPRLPDGKKRPFRLAHSPPCANFA